MDQLITQLTDARLKWAAAKRLATVAKRHYDVIKAQEYLSHPKGGHYYAQAKATSDPDVNKARIACETAEMNCLDCWVAVGNAMAQLKQFTSLENPMTLDLE